MVYNKVRAFGKDVILLSSYQHTVMKGILGHDPELKFSGKGTPTLNFTLYLNQAKGSIRIPCVAFDDVAKQIYDEKTKGATLTLQLEVISHFNSNKEQTLKYKVLQLL